MRARLIPIASTVALLAGLSLPHVRLINSSNGNALFWQSPGSIGIVIQSDGSDDIADGSHETALRTAIGAWNGVTGTTALMVENTAAGQQARTDWAADDIHLILFDENNSSGFFPLGSGTVAITPVQFFSSGRIADADVLFNGRSFSFTTAGDLGAFDVGDVATHELGHLLGLDHTGFTGASMYPYVSPTVILHRSPSADDENGLQHAYPAGSHGSISGTVRRAADNSVVPGAHVGARDVDGRPAAATVASNTGTFTLRGLPTGDYTLYASPLDHPVSNANLTSGHTVAVDFESTIGTTVSVSAGSTTAYGDLLVDADVTLSLGRSFDEFPIRATIGATSAATLHGAGMGPTCTLVASDPAITITPLSWIGATLVDFSIDVPPGTPVGHVDLELSDPAGALSLLCGAIEIVPDDPLVSTVVPPNGSPSGGDSLTITGSGFRPGARVVIGPSLYVDGAPGGCTVVDPATITLTTAATASGAYDVVVIDPTGVEGRAGAGFEFVSLPQIAVVFPPSGSDAGGTQLVVTGSGFSDPMTVRIDGVVQSSVVFESSTQLRVTTEAGVAGAVVLEVEDAANQVASAAFTYVAQADPVITQLAPASGTTVGGTSVTLTGTSFSASSTVVFGADPDTGLGGVPAASVTFVDAATLEVVTPAHAGGSVSVLVADGTSGQAHVLASAFSFLAPSSGGGGGCSTVPMQPPANWRSVLAGAGWIPLAWLLLLLERRRAQRAYARI